MKQRNGDGLRSIEMSHTSMGLACLPSCSGLVVLSSLVPFCYLKIHCQGRQGQGNVASSQDRLMLEVGSAEYVPPLTS